MSCHQKKLFINLKKLDVKELRIYYNQINFPALHKDNEGNYIVSFYNNDTVYTSTSFREIKNFRNVFCINEGKECMFEDHEIKNKGFEINVYSHFSSDTSIKPYDSFLIERIRKSNK